jgi:hypothetical protein
MPLALLYFAIRTLSDASLNDITTVEIASSILIGTFFGYKSLSGIKLYPDKTHGHAIIKGTWDYLKWFALSMACRAILLGGLLAIYGAAALSNATEGGFLLSTAIFVGVRSAGLYYRAEKLGIPLASRRS